MMMPCKKITRLVSASLDRRLSLNERLGIFVHFLMCKNCAHYEKQMLFVRAASRRIADHWDANNDAPRLSPEAVIRIKNHINQHDKLH